MKINPALIRNGLRYAAGALVTYGVVSAETAQVIQNDPIINSAVATGVGIVVGAVTEIVYGLAKKWGWRT